MLEMVAAAACWVIQSMLGLLPDSPFQVWLSDLDVSMNGFVQGLRMLNWLVDIHGMVVLLDLWLLAIQAYMLWYYGMGFFDVLKTILSGILGQFGGFVDMGGGD